MVAGTAVVAATVGSTTGDLLVVAVGLALACASPLPGLVGALAAAAVATRWGTTSLDSIAGIQSVVGSGGFVGPSAAAAASWVAAAAVVVAVRRPHPGVYGWLVALPAGLFAGALVAGPGWTDDPLVRLAGVVVGAVVAVGVVVLRGRAGDLPFDAAAVVAGAAAVGLAAVA